MSISSLTYKFILPPSREEINRNLANKPAKASKTYIRCIKRNGWADLLPDSYRPNAGRHSKAVLVGVALPGDEEDHWIDKMDVDALVADHQRAAQAPPKPAPADPAPVAANHAVGNAAQAEEDLWMDEIDVFADYLRAAQAPPRPAPVNPVPVAANPAAGNAAQAEEDHWMDEIDVDALVADHQRAAQAPPKPAPVNPAPVAANPVAANAIPVIAKPAPVNPAPVAANPVAANAVPVIAKPAPINPAPVAVNPVVANAVPVIAKPAPVNPVPHMMFLRYFDIDANPVVANAIPVIAKPAPVNPAPVAANPVVANAIPVIAKPAPANPAPVAANPVVANAVPIIAKPAPVNPAPVIAKPVPVNPAPVNVCGCRPALKTISIVPKPLDPKIQQIIRVYFSNRAWFDGVEEKTSFYRTCRRVSRYTVGAGVLSFAAGAYCLLYGPRAAINYAASQAISSIYRSVASIFCHTISNSCGALVEKILIHGLKIRGRIWDLVISPSGRPRWVPSSSTSSTSPSSSSSSTPSATSSSSSSSTTPSATSSSSNSSTSWSRESTALVAGSTMMIGSGLVRHWASIKERSITRELESRTFSQNELDVVEFLLYKYHRKHPNAETEKLLQYVNIKWSKFFPYTCDACSRKE